MRGIALTNELLKGLLFIQKYRFLTISQFTLITGLTRATSSQKLRIMERLGLLGHIGNQLLAGQGKTPKTYYLKEKGYNALFEYSNITPEQLGGFTRAHTGITWSPVMYHRIESVSVLIQMELELEQIPEMRLVGTKLEYIRKRIEGKLTSETTDFYRAHQSKIVRIVPDAVFAIENTQNGGKALFFLELDRNTEPITSSGLRNSIVGKFEKYDAYLKSRKFADTYKAWGEFKNFTCLLVTPSKPKGGRIDNIRKASSKLPSELHKFYKLGSTDNVIKQFFNPYWLTRDSTDERQYRLIQAR